jgi:hypothetical protein
VSNHFSAGGPAGTPHQKPKRHRSVIYGLGVIAIVATLVAASARATVVPPSATSSTNPTVETSVAEPTTPTPDPTTPDPTTPVPTTPVPTRPERPTTEPTTSVASVANTTKVLPTTSEPQSADPVVTVIEPSGPPASTVPSQTATSTLSGATTTASRPSQSTSLVPESSSTTSSTTTTSPLAILPANSSIGCIFVTADADFSASNGVQHQSAIGTPLADDDGVPGDGDSICINSTAGFGQPTLAAKRAVISVDNTFRQAEGRLVSFWAAVGSFAKLDRDATLRWKITSSMGSVLVDRTISASSQVPNETGPCGSRSGLIEALLGSGQLSSSPSPSTCISHGIRFAEFTVDLGRTLPCGDYLAETRLISGTIVSSKSLTFAIRCGSRLSVDFPVLDLPELSVGQTEFDGDGSTRKNPWIVTNRGNVPITISAIFSPLTSTESPIAFGTITGLLRLSGTEPGSGGKTITLCPGQKAVLSITVLIPDSAPVGPFSSSLSFDVSVAPAVRACP